MLIKLHSKNPQTGAESPIWVNVEKIGLLTPAKIPGDLADGQGNPIMKEGTLVRIGEAVVVVIETVNEVLEKIPDDEWKFSEPPIYIPTNVPEA